MSDNGLGVELDIHAALGQLKGGQAAIAGKLAQLEYELQDRIAILAGSTATSTSVRTTLVLASNVPLGRSYDVRMISFAPTPVTTAVACDLYIFTGSPSAGAVGSQYRDCQLGGNIPNTVTYSQGQFPIRGGDYLYVIFGTTSAANNVMATAYCGDTAARV